MGREKDRKLRRKKRRRSKLKKLKVRLAETKDPKERQRLINKIKTTSVYPPSDLPKE